MYPKQKQRTQIDSSTLEENENYFVAKLTRPLCQHAHSGPLLCRHQLEEARVKSQLTSFDAHPKISTRISRSDYEPGSRACKVHIMVNHHLITNLRLLGLPTNNHSVIVKKNKAIRFRLKLQSSLLLVRSISSSLKLKVVEKCFPVQLKKPPKDGHTMEAVWEHCLPRVWPKDLHREISLGIDNTWVGATCKYDS